MTSFDCIDIMSSTDGESSQLYLMPVEGTAMTAISTHESLEILDLMLKDFISDCPQDAETNNSVIQHIQAAARHIASARKLHLDSMCPPAITRQIDCNDYAEINKILSRQEKWVIRHIGKREKIDPCALGSESKRLSDLGLIEQEQSYVALTEKGLALNAMWNN